MKSPGRQLGNILIPPGVFPQEHELATVRVFTALGYNVEFLAPSRTPGQRTPDVVINGVAWEMKSPTGSGKRTIENILRRALTQCDNVIIDTRRCAIQQSAFRSIISREWDRCHSLRRLMLILADGELVDHHR